MMATDEPWTIGRLLTWTADFLGQRGADNPRLDAEVLLSHARRCRRIDLYAAYDEPADEATRATFREFVRRRAAGTPVAYLVGHREFYALDFEVTPDVLIPRPETELLVVALVDHVKQHGARRPINQAPAAADDLPTEHEAAPAFGPEAGLAGRPALEIADIGTGSGVLAVCAAKFAPDSRVTAVDISPAALVVARRNAERHGVGKRVEFLESNLFSAVPPTRQFDYVLSNPPYVSTDEMASLPPDVRDHEPEVALHAGERGTDVIVPLIAQSAERLRAGGLLLIEVSPMIADRVQELVHAGGAFRLDSTLRDAAGHARVIQAVRLLQ